MLKLLPSILSTSTLSALIATVSDSFFFSIFFIFLILLLKVPLVWNVPVHGSQLFSASDQVNLLAKPSATAKQPEMLSVQRVQGDPDPHNGTRSQETSCRT